MSHARLGCSNHRWPHCAGSVREEAVYPDTTNPAAIEGTGVHLLIEMCLLHNKRPIDFKDQVIGEGHKDKPMGWKINKERMENADYVFAYLERFDTSHVIEAESRSNPGEKFGRSDWWGTCDITIKGEDYLEIIDYKNGRGFVTEKDNSQLISYAYGRYDGESNVTMTIIQPKTFPPIRSQTVTGYELEKEAKILAEAANKTDDEQAPLSKGDWCKWCKHKPNCVEHNSKAKEVLLNYDKLVASVESMTNAELSDILDIEAIVLGLFDKAREEAETRIDAGDSINGWTMKPGRVTKKWGDTASLEKYLKKVKVKKADYTKTELLSPAQMLKLEGIDQVKLNEFIEEKAGTMKLSKAARIKF